MKSRWDSSRHHRLRPKRLRIIARNSQQRRSIFIRPCVNFIQDRYVAGHVASSGVVIIALCCVASPGVVIIALRCVASSYVVIVAL